MVNLVFFALLFSSVSADSTHPAVWSDIPLRPIVNHLCPEANKDPVKKAKAIQFISRNIVMSFYVMNLRAASQLATAMLLLILLTPEGWKAE
jgi:hypothetical protein